MSYRRKLTLLILGATLVRCIVAAWLEFGNDEVYYWTYALHLQWNYFDHPPMVALMVRLSTLGMNWVSEFSVRLGSIFCAALNTWLIFRIGTRLKSEQTGWYAGVLYTSSVYSSIIAGTFILPDSPQVLFWMISIYLMVEILMPGTTTKKTNLLFVLLGAAIGLCIMSKVHGIFLWAGFGAYILFYQRPLFRNPFLYIGAVITLIIISPIYFWNAQNHFITYSFHNDRVGIFGRKLDTDGFLQQLLGSVLYSNPINFVVYVVGITGLIRLRSKADLPYLRLLLWLGLPLVLVLLLISLFSETLPHWSGPAYIGLSLLAALYFAEKDPVSHKLPMLIKSALVTIFVVIVLALPAIRFLPFTIGSREPAQLGKSDITLDLNGWKQFAVSFDSLYRSDSVSHIMKPGAWIISDYWFPAAHLDYYFANPRGIDFIAVGSLKAIHHFAWLNVRKGAPPSGTDAYFIYPTNYYGIPQQRLRNCFEKVDDSLLIPQIRMGIPVRNFVIYRMHAYRSGIPDNGVLNN